MVGRLYVAEDGGRLYVAEDGGRLYVESDCWCADLEVAHVEQVKVIWTVMSCVNCDCQVISTVVWSHVNGNVEFCQLSCHVMLAVMLCQLWYRVMLAVMLSCVSCDVMIQCLHSLLKTSHFLLFCQLCHWVVLTVTYYVSCDIMWTVSLSGVNCDRPCQLWCHGNCH